MITSLALEDCDGRRHTVTCECKHWNTEVPQSVVHGLLTVMSGTGAHIGYIIGASGFQSSAYEAAEQRSVAHH